ncbi:hypothetical protein [Pseudooceanicola sp. LIPI14-2-Ac024]|uniref:hypothetical protein n=1 Tax=Pseudooceanicola sp. LIPI14-2-Ac024 TaxID=3344875 RepID=UPI0035CF22A9
MIRDVNDPKGLIRESYRIEGIGLEECRSIFMDWALSLPDGTDTGPALDALIETYGAEAPDHPMTGILREGRAGMVPSGRRGGRRGRMQ